MAEKDLKQPATKGDLKAGIAAVRADLKFEIASVKTELKGDLANLSGQILKINFRLDRVEDTLSTKVATKDDINRLFNLLDAISGDIKSYQRKDTLRGDAVMRHEEKLSDHENRIALLETKK